MRLPMILAASVCLASCASTQTVLSKEPSDTFTSAKSPGVVASCIASRNSSTPMLQEDGSQVVLIKNNLYDAVSSAFTIRPEGKGSRVEYRRSFIALGESWKSCL